MRKGKKGERERARKREGEKERERERERERDGCQRPDEHQTYADGTNFLEPLASTRALNPFANEIIRTTLRAKRTRQEVKAAKVHHGASK